MATYTGTAAADTWVGTADNDTASGLGGNDNLSGVGGNDVLIGGAGADTLDGGAGTNTASYVGSILANLSNSSVNTGEAAGDVYINIQNLTGGTGADTLIGDAQDNVLDGAGGNDVLIGGEGADTLIGGTGFTNDTASYANAATGVTVDLTNGANNTGEAAGDTYSSIESFIGSVHDDVFVGAAAVASTLRGGAGDDVYYVGSTSNLVFENAGEGTDSVFSTATSYTLGGNIENLTYTGSAAFTGTGNGLNNVLTGNAGNDTLVGGAGADTLDGGGGVNTAGYASTVVGGSMLANLSNSSANTGEAAGDVYINIQNLRGGDGHDTLIGDAQDNVLDGAGGNDVLIGGEGADTLIGGTGFTNDTASYANAATGVTVDLTNGANNTGEAAGDTYSSIESFIGSVHDDVFVGAAAVASTLRGGAGDDVYYVGSTSNLVFENAGEGTDSVFSTATSYTLGGNIENLTYTGSAAFTGTGNGLNNVLTGDAGNDTLVGGAGADTLDGGGGVNTASYVGSVVGVGAQLVSLANPSANVGQAAGDVYINIHNLIGGDGADTLIGDAQNNVLDGGAGNDVLIGGEGADTLIGDTGFSNDTASYVTAASAVTIDLTNIANNTGDAAGDTYTSIESFIGTAYNDVFVGAAAVASTLRGGAGDDVYYVGSTSNLVFENAGEGTDSVFSTATSYTLGGNIENLTYTGSAAFTGTGNGLNNVLTGDAGNDTLVGGAGADTLDGGGGVNTASYVGSVVGVGAQLVSLANPSANVGQAAGDVYINIHNLIGGDGADTLIGDAQNNVLDGGAGNDVLIGGEGADTLIGDTGFSNDTASYVTAASAVTIDLTNIANNTGDAAGDTYTSIESFIGTAYNDVFVGAAAVASTLRGGAGDDVYYVGSTSNLVFENAGEGTDSVFSTATSYTLGGNIENLTYTGSAAFTGTGNGLNNVLTGDAGNDTLVGGAGADTLDGGGGVNTAGYASSAIVGLSVLANLSDSSANTGEAAGDVYINIHNLQAADGADTLIGDAQDNVLDGGGGNDLLIGGGGADTLIGGTGFTNDTASYANAATGVTVDLTNGANNTGEAAGDTYSSIESFIGSVHDDVFVGAAAVASTLRGGAGDDVYYVGSTSNLVFENAGEGTDSVFSTATSYTLGGNIENLTYTGSAAFTGTGNGLNNVLTGDAGNDTLVGGAGADTLDGGGGNDMFRLNSLAETTNSAPDQILDFAGGDRIDVSAIDADSGASGKQVFHFDGTTGGAGDVGARYDAAQDVTVVELWVNNDASVDATLLIAGNVSLTSSDFVF